MRFPVAGGRAHTGNTPHLSQKRCNAGGMCGAPPWRDGWMDVVYNMNDRPLCCATHALHPEQASEKVEYSTSSLSSTCTVTCRRCLAAYINSTRATVVKSCIVKISKNHGRQTWAPLSHVLPTSGVVCAGTHTALRLAAQS